MIKIQLNELLTCYLKKEFNSNSDVIVINKYNPIGKFIMSHIKYSQKKIEQIGNLTIELPYDDFKYNKKSYPFLNALDYRNIVDYINSLFFINIDRIFLTGDRIGIERNKIIESIIDYYKIPITSSSFEMLKKRDYRKRRSTLKIFIEIAK